MIIGGVLAGGILLLLLWRAVRFVLRLALIGVLLLLLCAGALLWWYGFGVSSAPSARDARSLSGTRHTPAR